MNRVEAAINEGRCVLIFGGKVLQDAETLGELRRRPQVPATVLSGEVPSPAAKLDANILAPATTKEGGVICLVEAEGPDSIGLGQLANIIQGAAHKPRLVVAARAFNPFALPAALRTLKLEHEKSKPRDFLFKLPVPTAAPVAVVAPEAPKKKSAAPKIAFVGREAELAFLAEHATGPVVVAGPPGVGKRWLVEKALSGVANRVPDFVVGWGSEADSLYARIAVLAKEAGDSRLGDALNKPDARPVPSALAQLAVESLAQLDVTFVVDRLDAVMRRDGTFHREGRFELLLRALLTGQYKARIVFLSTIHPRFYREGEGLSLPVLALGGVKGKELHEIFEAYRVEDFPRENFGPISDRIHGHPLAARMFAVAVRDPEARDEILESARFLKMDDVADLDAVKRRIQKTVQGLTDEERHDLALLAHFRQPFTATDSEITGVKRESRLNLLGKGLLDMVPDEGRERTFYVHRLVAEALPRQETTLFDLCEALGNQYIAASRKEKGQKALALAQEGNRLLFEAHRTRDRARMPHPDHDPAVEAIRGLIRSRKPRFDLAQQRLVELLATDPANTEANLLKAELLAVTKAKNEEVLAALAVAEKHPTPEVFHAACDFAAERAGGRKGAAAVLERGCVAFPENARMKRRLAGLLADANRLDHAATVLKEAMALEPMMPDTYGLLGEIYLRMGRDCFDKAHEALAEARRLDPNNTLHMSRLGALLIETAEGDAAKLDEAQKLLEDAVAADKKNYGAHLFLGRLIIDRGGDLDRANWLLKNAAGLVERATAPMVERARIAARKQLWPEAEALLEKAQKADPGDWHVFYARAEMFELRGLVFNAEPEYRHAQERTMEGTPMRAKVDAALARMADLIASGAALEMAKAAEAAGVVAPPPSTPGPKRDPGTTTRRRRRGKGKGEGQADGAAADGAEVAAAEGGDAGAESTHGVDASPEAVAEVVEPAPEVVADAAPAEETPAAE